MGRVVQTLGSHALTGLATHAMCFGGLATFITVVAVLVSPGNRTPLACEFFVFSLTACVWGWKTLKRALSGSQELVKKINQENALSLNPVSLLGYPGPVFWAFDQSHRKLAVCNRATGEYRIEDFAFVLSWQCVWTIRESRPIPL